VPCASGDSAASATEGESAESAFRTSEDAALGVAESKSSCATAALLEDAMVFRGAAESAAAAAISRAPGGVALSATGAGLAVAVCASEDVALFDTKAE
jgi:hypothetical protein